MIYLYRSWRVLENRLSTNNGIIENLEKSVGDAVDAANQADLKHKEVIKPTSSFCVTFFCISIQYIFMLLSVLNI